MKFVNDDDGIFFKGGIVLHFTDKDGFRNDFKPRFFRNFTFKVNAVACRTAAFFA